MPSFPLPHPARRVLLVSAALLGLAVPGGCSWSDDAGAPVTTLPPPPTFPQPDDPGPPGTLLRADRVEQPPEGTTAWRIAYGSRTAGGEPVAVTGQLIVPAGDIPAGGWPLVTWAHPTTGTGDRCAPSLEGPTDVHLVPDLAREGVAVVATDYEGLGTEGGHPYLVGRSEGRAVLDAARAATALPAAGVARDAPMVIAGFSQGGHAALWAAQLAAEEAPELDIRGVLAAAPVTDVGAFAARSEDWPEQFGVLVTIAWGMAQAYPELDLGDVLTDEGEDRLDALEQECIAGVVITYTDPVDELLDAAPRTLPDWRRRLDENLVGQAPVGVPALVIQGDADPIVDPALTRAAVDRLCALGDTVEYREIPGVDHGVLTPARAVPWILDRIAGRPAASTCTG